MDPEELKKLVAEANNLLLEARHIEEEWKGKDMPADVKKAQDARLAKVIDCTETVKRNQILTDQGKFYHDPDKSNRLPVDTSAGELKGREGRNTPEWKGFRQAVQGYKGVVSLKGNGDPEQKALQSNIADQGGFLVAPQEFVAELIQKVHDSVSIEPIARTFTLSHAQSLGAPSLDTTLNDADWTGEVTAANEDTALKVGKRELNPSKLSKLVKISQTLIRVAAVDPEGLVSDELAYKFAITKDKAFLTGSGQNQPLGVFTASANGINTDRDVAAANNNKVIGDDFIKTKMSLKPQYFQSKSIQWLLHRTVLQSLMLEKASTAGTYLFTPGLAVDMPNMILGIPYRLSENAPSTLTTGLYVAILGDFRWYWIANSMEFEVQVLNELYALNDYIGYIGRLWSDGMPVLSEAFARLKLA